MATTSSNSGQRVAVRVAGFAAVAALGGLLLLELVAAPPAAADVQTESGTVTLSSSSSMQSVLLDQFDPGAGSLDEVTITVAVDASAEVAVTNLTAAAKATTVTLEVTASAAGPGGAAVTATAIDTASSNLAPNASFTFAVDGAADEDRVVTDPAVLAGFVGTGTVSFDLTGLVGADVEGPATWRGRGAMEATATVTVAYDFTPNAPPSAVGDTATVAEDAAASVIDVLGNDTDVDGGPMSIDSASDPANGTVVVTGGGSGLTYQPDGNYCNDPPGTTLDTFTYTLNGGSTATVSVTVTCVLDEPVAVDDTVSVAEDSAAATVDVLGNDSDPDPVGMTIASASDPANGTVVVNPDGSDLSYEPDPNYCNTPPGTTFDTFTYTLDPGGDTATVTVTVTCVDDPPVAVDDAATVIEDDPATAIAVLANDTDIDAGPMTIASTVDPANGTVIITGGGTALTYRPAPEFCGTDTFTYTLNGASTATVSMTVTCVDDPPVAVDDDVTVAEDAAAIAIPVLANDTDVDDGPISIGSASDPANGTVIITGGGTGLTYQPDANYCNDPPGTTPDTFTYTLNGGSTVTVSVAVTCVLDDPVAVDDAVAVAEDIAATTIDVLGNDSDPDSVGIAIATVTDPANGAVVVNPAGSDLTYQPDPNYCNTPPGTTLDTFTYTLDPGGDIATVTVTVSCVDDPPVAVDDAATVAEDAAAAAIPVLANDTDIDAGPMTIASATDPADGTVIITGGGTGLTYQPEPDFCGTDTFTYTLNGGSTATVSMTVTCVDDPPVAVDDAATVIEDAAATAIDVLANDTDVDGGSKMIGTASDPANGTVVVAGGGAGLTYQPDANSCNDPPGTTPDTFTYTLDGGSTATVSVTVTCAPDDPAAVDDVVTVAEDSVATTIDVLGNDSDPDSVGIAIDTVTDPVNGTVVVNAEGSDLTYQPDPNYCNTPPGTSLDTFTYSLTPGGDTATVTVTVTCVDDPPVAVNDAATVAEDAAATAIAVLANDTDSDAGPITIASTSDPANGTVIITGGGTGLTYQPDANYCNTPPGTSPDTFTYTLNGGSTATVTVTVTCVNDPPVAQPQSYAAHANMRAAVPSPGLLQGATDADGTTLTVGTLSATTPAGGTITNLNNATGAFEFDPPPGFTGGNVTFTYTVCDNGTPLPSLCSTPATVTVAVAGPVIWFVDDSATGTETGRLSAPFNTLAEAVTAIGADTGERVFLFAGSYGTGINLNQGGWLVGQGVTGASFDGVMGITPPAGTIARPAIATGTATVQNTAGLATNARVTGVAISTAANTALSGTGGLTGADVSQTSLATTTGTALSLNNVAGAVAITNLTHSGAGSGIDLTNVNATVTVAAGSISNTTVAAVSLNGGTGAFTFAGTVTNSTGRSVQVQNKTAGTATFSGAVTATAGTGIALTTNTGATINFTGDIDLSTGANPAFTATGGGTVTATNADSTLTTTTATALNVANTTIGAAGLTFRSISASGGANGIVLNTTGSAGGLTVTGTGTTDGSGGTIQNTTTRGVNAVSSAQLALSNMTLTNAATVDFPASPTGLSLGVNTADNAAIHLQSVNGAALTNVDVNGSAEHGINIHDVQNLTLVNSTILNAGNGPDEDGIHAYRLSGTSAISNTTITSSGDDNVNIQNNTNLPTAFTNVGTINVTGGSYNTGVLGSGLLFGIRGTHNTTLNIANVTSNNNFSGGIVADSFDTATMDLEVSGSTITNNNDAIQVSANNGTADFDIHDNPNITNQDFVNITVLKAAFSTTGTLEGRIRNNPNIDVENGHTADAILIFQAGGGSLNVVVTNNDIDYAGTQRAIAAQGGQDGAGALNVTITDNDIDMALDGVGNGGPVIFAQASVTSPQGDGSSLCADIGGAGTLANIITHSLGGTMPAGDVRIRQRFLATARLPGYAGAPTDTAAVVAYLAGRNTLPNTPPATATAEDTIGFTGGGACTQPSP